MLKLIVVSIVSLSTCLFLGFGSCNGQDQSGLSKASESTTQFDEKIRPLLVKYCSDCHAPGEMEGLDFLVAETPTDVAKLRGLYAGVAEQIEDRTMPPKDVDHPTDSERKLVADWIKKTLDLKPADTDRIAQYVVEVYEDKKGNLWFGTMSKGMARYDGHTLTWFSQKDGLPSNAVPSFAEDKDGNLWVGTQNGVGKFNGKTFIRVGSADGLPTPNGPSPLSSAGVKADKEGNIWVSVGRKVFRYNGKSFEEFKLPIVKEKITSYAILAGDVSLAMEDKAGNLWFSTDGDGAYKFDGKSFTHFTTKDGLSSNNVTSIIEDKQGNIWFACMQSYQPRMTGDGGVCRYDGKTFTSFPKIKGLSENDIYTIYEIRAGDIWIGASGVGAYRYDGEIFTLFNETNRKHWTRNFGVQGVMEDRNGTLWFGFSGGLFRFNGKSFFNVTKDGPWTDLVSAMADVAAGGKEESTWFHAGTQSALSALAKGQFDQAKAVLLKLKREEPNEPTIQERKINEVGYRLVFTDRLELAIEVFKLNTHLYPQAFNTFDSLGEAYLRSGNEQLAVKSYRKSLELNPKNAGASEALSTIVARKRYESVLVAPKGWLEEVLVVPPSFAPTMSLKGMEHLRLPPEFRTPDSDWFLSYLFAIELTEPTALDEKMIGDQLLLYFRGLAAGGSDQNGKMIETDKFSIEPHKRETGHLDGEHTFTLTWQEPFANATHLKQNIRVKVISGKNKHGVVFVCGSPQPFGSEVWTELLKIRTAFESATVPVESMPTKEERSDD